MCHVQFLCSGSILGTIDKDVLKLLCEDLQTHSENLISELKRAVEVMKSEPNTFHQFTVFSDMVLTFTYCFVSTGGLL